jgi:hypothetical protein
MSHSIPQIDPKGGGEATPDDLMDVDGENRAVRSFLLAYGAPAITVGAMKRHLKYSGFPHWPAWADENQDNAHLTKGGAQDWLRHLFALETK